MLCNKCKIEQPEEEFYLKWKNKDIRHKICRTCKKEWAQSKHGRQKRYNYNSSKKGKQSVARYRVATKEQRRKWQQNYAKSGKQKHHNLARRFKMTLDDYKRMIFDQKGVCAICGNAETAMLCGKVKDLAVDHAHETGKVRELLCQKCNLGIAQFRENIGYLANAIVYIEKHKKTEEGSPLETIEAGVGA